MSFQSYPIYFRFRGHQRTGLVHQFEAHTLVYTSDIEIIRDFGGRILIEGGKTSTAKQAPDAQDLFRAVQDQIR